MSVLIKGMDMPTNTCLALNIYPDGRVATNLDANCATAVPVPTPHGRLIDAGAILGNKGVGTQIAGWGKMYHETVIEFAPTIIEAEGEDE